MSAKLGTYVFPKKGQSASTQNSDESYCYNWAKSQTNFDPMTAPPPQAVSTAPQPTGQEAAPRQGATRGAAVGAVGGAIGGNAGKGAAIGATVGALKGRRDRNQAAAQQQQQQEAAAATATQQQQQLDAHTGEFKKAFSACLESKDYSVK